MPIVSLLTDFGLQDGFVGVMKVVILGISPEAKIVDLSHSVTPQNVRQGAYILSRHVSYFPPGSVHVAVVDPGVGTQRRALAAQIGDQYFVAPDNGLLTPLILAAEKEKRSMTYIHLENPQYWLAHVSQTFHGRDIFAPVGAHLSAGVPLHKFGSLIDDPVLLDWSIPEKISGGWQAHITGVDVFGNLATDLPADDLGDWGKVRILVGDHEIIGLVDSYGFSSQGSLIALVDSQGFLEIAVVDGSAAMQLDVNTGDKVTVLLQVD